MKMNPQLSLLLAAALAMGAAACGDSKEKPSKLECTSNAQCADRTDGKTECDLIHNVCVEPSVQDHCDADEDCAGRTDGRTKCDTTLNLCTTPSGNTCTPETQETDCASKLCGEDGTCKTVKMVNCDTNVPEHAIVANDALKVAVNFDGTNWEAPAVCPWTCDTNGYQLNEAKTGCETLPGCTEANAAEKCRSKVCGEDGTCATTKQDVCLALSAAELAAVNASEQDESAQVTWTFVEHNDGSSEWLRDKCPITKCVDEDAYEINEAKDACISLADICSGDEDCAGNGEKTYCHIELGESSGTCIKPECNTNDDCAESLVGPFCHNKKCTKECWFDYDCANNSNGLTMCDNANGTESTWECKEPECEPEECSADGDSYCKDGHWTECTSGLKCALTGGEGIQGTCQVPQGDNCSPACSADEFCRDNGENLTEGRFTCEYKAAQLTSPTIRIAQLYFGGFDGSTTSTYQNGFLELYNYGDAEVDLTGLFVYQGTKAGSFRKLLVDFSYDCNGACKVAAKSYFVLRNTTPSNVVGGTSVPMDAKFTSNVSLDGSLALTVGEVTDTTCNGIKAKAVDLIGMGSAFCSETTPAQGIATGVGENNAVTEGNRGTHSYQRDESLTDTGNNYYDFIAKPVVLHKQ